MANVDFTNARLELVADNDNTTPVYESHSNLNVSSLINNAGASIVTNQNMRTLVSEQKKLVLIYTGQFTASGNEFYIKRTNYRGRWRVSNISFQTDDTYTFQIPVTLTCL